MINQILLFIFSIWVNKSNTASSNYLKFVEKSNLLYLSDTLYYPNSQLTYMANRITGTSVKMGIKAKNFHSKNNLVSKQEIDLLPKENESRVVSINVDSSPKNVWIKLRSFYDSFISKYVKEEIILYKNTSGILIDPTRKENFLKPQEKKTRKLTKENFKRALQVEKIHFKLPQSLEKAGSDSIIKLKWNYHISPVSPLKNIFKILTFNSLRSPQFPTIQQKELLKKLENFPVFSVENNLRQIVLAYPPETFIKNLKDKLYDFYYRLFVWEQDTRATTIGFFFFNPEDALLYNHNINTFGALAAADLGTKISVFRLSTAYTLSRTSSPEIRFMFIPDIREIGNLVTFYRHTYGHLMSFHANQEINRNGFANQPIYIIQNSSINKELFSNSTRNFSDQTPVFFSIEGAELAWKYLRELNRNLPVKPKILVYNFNNFIYDYENDPDFPYKNFLFVPNRQTSETINFLQKEESSKSSLQKAYEGVFSLPVFFVKLWFNRFKLVLFHAPRINEFPRRELFLSQ